MLKTKLFISSEKRIINKNFTSMCHSCNDFYNLSSADIIKFFDTYNKAESKILTVFEDISDVRKFVKNRMSVTCFKILSPLLPEGLTLDNAIDTYRSYRKGEDIKPTRTSTASLKEIATIYLNEKYELAALQEFESYLFHMQTEISSLYNNLHQQYNVNKDRYFES